MRAIENKIEIHFDGGCRPTNPGNKYGSFEVLLDGRQVFKASRMELGRGTNNEAEFDSLIAALRFVVNDLSVGGFDPKTYAVSVFTDSTIVANRLTRERARDKGEPAQRMAALAATCNSYLAMFGHWSCKWNGRSANVERFGH